MLDAFEVLTTSGIVLWRKHYAPLSSNVINSFINDVFIEERQKPAASQEGSVNAPYRKDKYTLRYTTAKDVGLIFVVGMRASQQMSIQQLANLSGRQFINRCCISRGWITS